MRSGGFPCRFGGCDVRFAVLEEGSMPALLAASTVVVDVLEQCATIGDLHHAGAPRGK